MVAAFFLMYAALPADGGQAPQVLVDQWDQKVIRRSVLIAPSEFSPTRVEDISRKFLDANRGKFTLLSLSIFIDEGDAIRTGNGKITTDVDYRWWRQLYDLYGREPLAMAQTIAIRGDAVLKWRDMGGRLSRKVLSGRDPLLISVSGSLFEILDVVMWPRLYHERLHKDSMEVRAMVRTQTTSADSLRSFTRLLASRLDLSDFWVAFRQDVWFITNDDFPIVYRFEQVLNPPTEAEYRRGFNANCQVKSGAISCTVRPR